MNVTTELLLSKLLRLAVVLVGQNFLTKTICLTCLLTRPAEVEKKEVRNTEDTLTRLAEDVPAYKSGLYASVCCLAQLPH